VPEGKTNSEAIVWTERAWSPTCQRADLHGVLYVLAKHGLCDAYNLQTGEDIYRQRLPLIGSGFSASPVAADGKIYVANEDGEMLSSQRDRSLTSRDKLDGELLMATRRCRMV